MEILLPEFLCAGFLFYEIFRNATQNREKKMNRQCDIHSPGPKGFLPLPDLLI